LETLQHQDEHQHGFEVLKTHIECMIFVKIPSEKSPTTYTQHLIDYIQKQRLIIRYIQRVIPLELTCAANLTDIQKYVQPWIDLHFNSHFKDSCTFAILYKALHHQKLKREEVISLLASIINPSHQVNLKQPDKLILIQVFKNIFGISILEHYYLLKKYNLTELSSQIRLNSFLHDK
jgi:tRNA acetyltransferase TAN1